MINRDKMQDLGEPAINATAGLVVSVSALAHPLLGVATAVLTPIIQDLSKRMLSPKELSRIERVHTLTIKKVRDELERGAGLRPDLQKSGLEDRVQELVEGSLLSARNAFEEKKLPLIANLCARSLFTSTPIENLTQTLIITERLSYRQLCIVALYSKTAFSNEKPGLLNKNSMSKWSTDEAWLGVYSDLLYLIHENMLVQIENSTRYVIDSIGDITPNLIRPTYPGILLINGLQLDTIPDEDTRPLRKILS